VKRNCSLAALALALLAIAYVVFGRAPEPVRADIRVPAERVEIDTSLGKIVVVLDRRRAPKTVANFLRYVDRHFYDGGTFFRAVPNFVIQGGNKTKESPNDKPIQLEDPQTTGLKNLDGSLAMARTSDPNSATSEFFIDIGPQSFLDGGNGSPGYAVFGSVTSGMDVVKKIVSQPAPGQMLTTPVKIIKIDRIK